MNERYKSIQQAAGEALAPVRPAPTSQGKLILVDEGCGHRHYLDGKPIHCADFLEIQLGGARGPWVMVRYEASLGERVSVCLYAIGARIYHDNDAAFRWPKE